MADIHETFEEFTLKKTKSGWLVTVKGDHKLKGDWHFKDHDAAVDFVNEGKTSGGGGGGGMLRFLWYVAITAAIVWVALVGIPWWLNR